MEFGRETPFAFHPETCDQGLGDVSWDLCENRSRRAGKWLQVLVGKEWVKLVWEGELLMEPVLQVVCFSYCMDHVSFLAWC